MSQLSKSEIISNIKVQTGLTVEKSSRDDKGPSSHLFDPFFSLFGTNSKYEVKRPSQQSVWVANAMDIRKWVSHIPIIAVAGDGEDEKQVDSPITDLLANPVGNDSWCQFCDKLVDDADTEGEYFIAKYSRLGKLTELNPEVLFRIDPRKMVLDKVDAFDQPKLWKWRKKQGSREVEVLIEDKYLIRFARFNRYAEHRGLGIVDRMLETIDSEYMGRNHNKMMMKHSGRINNLITFDREMPPHPDDVQRAREAYERSVGGYKNAGKDMFVGEKMNVQSLNANSKDLDWEKAQKMMMTEISSAFGVPKVMLGEDENGSYNNYETARKTLYEDRLIPMLKKDILDPIFKALEHMDTKVRIKPDISEVAAFTEDEKERAEIYEIYVRNGVSRAQAKRASRAPIDLNPEFKDLEFVPVGLQEVGAEPEPVQNPVQPSQEEEDDEDKSYSGLIGGVVLKEPDGPIEVVQVVDLDEETKQARDLIYKTISTGRDEVEAEMFKKLETFFFKQRSRVLEAFAEFREDDLSIITATFTGGMEKREPTIEELEYASAIFNLDFEDAAFAEVFRPILAKAVGVALTQVVQEQGADEEIFNNSNFLEARLQQEILLQSVNQTTRKRLALAFDEVAEGLRQGLTTEDIAKNIEARIKDVFKEASKSRAKTIARTEIGRAFTATRLEAFKELGVENVQWLSSRDEVVRDSHDQHGGLDGTVVPLGQSFIAGIDLKFPKDPNAPASETINCRCEIISAD